MGAEAGSEDGHGNAEADASDKDAERIEDGQTTEAAAAATAEEEGKGSAVFGAGIEIG